MKCYKCSSRMTRKALDGVLVDSCPTCEGIWLDGGELEMLKNGARKTTEEILLQARSEISREKRRLVTAHEMCPRCQQDKLHEKIVAGTALDTCASCGGLYFDWSELSKVLQRSETRGFSALIAKIRALL